MLQRHTRILLILFLSGLIAAGLASSFHATSKIGLQSAVELPFHLSAHVDTSAWAVYQNSEYGYQFKHPQTWQIVEAESTNQDYIDRKWVRVVSPNNPRAHSVIGVTEYRISVESLSGYPALSFIRNLDDLEAILQTKGAAIPAKLTMLSTNDGIKRVVLSQIHGNPNSILGFVIAEKSAIQIIVGPGFLKAHTADDIATFLGILSTFAIE